MFNFLALVNLKDANIQNMKICCILIPGYVTQSFINELQTFSASFFIITLKTYGTCPLLFLL